MTSRYELLGLIARGGMAEVHLARARSEGGFTKLLALKRILETYADSAQITAMFMDEARLAARLSHPNIVQVFDFGHDEQGYFIAMEYVPGPDLANVLRTLRHAGERPPEAPMLDVVIQVLRGLEHAHRLTGPDGLSANVIHRDVSPGNVLLTADGAAKLSDFGVARAAERLSEKTRAGKTKGKAAYMSPEQARSRPLDARSDVFASGLLLWEVLAGERCYVANDDATLIRMAARGEVRPLSTVGVEVEPALLQILERALQVEPEARFASAQAMAEALEAYHRQAFPMYTPSALGAVVQRALSQLPPLPHLSLPASAPEAAKAEPAPLPSERPPRISVRRPRAELEGSAVGEKEKLIPAAPLMPKTEAEQSAASSPGAVATATSVAGYALFAALIAVAVVVGLLYWDHKKETEVPVVNGPPAPMSPLGTHPPPEVAQKGAPPQQPGAPTPTPTVSPPAEPQKPASHEKGTGYLSVKCEPWCNIVIDGKPTHLRSPQERIPVAAGAHLIKVVNPTVNLEKHAVVMIHPDREEKRYFNLVLDR